MDILIRADGYNEIGLGHIYRAVILADELSRRGERVAIITRRGTSGAEKLVSSGHAPLLFESNRDMLSIVEHASPDVIVTDMLDTEMPMMRFLRGNASRLVTLEDRGTGTEVADAVINAIYEPDGVHGRDDGWYWGSAYMCLNREAVESPPASFNAEPRRVTASFGGADPSDMSFRIFRIFETLSAEMPDLSFEIVLGPGYTGKLLRAGEPPSALPNIVTHHAVPSLVPLMRSSDLLVCSQGTTPYEAACLGLPACVIAQNERETTHTFACEGNGFSNLGLGSSVSDDDIASEMRALLSDGGKRWGMRDKMLGLGLGGGTERVCDIIMGLDAPDKSDRLSVSRKR